MLASPPEQWYDVHHFLVQGGYHPVLDRRHLRNKPWLPIATEMMQSKQSHVCSSLSITFQLIHRTAASWIGLDNGALSP
jgi:hypothetical protein